ncbi:MAG TPA: HoxN/HupN/NixA family nickel/cobalt transporter [Chloroflexota bacterium]|nr:HoxN/HupN/NixA family nickel/cobalt transporter [Chloroflexota bacterium]
MLERMRQLWREASPELRRRMITMYALLAVLNLGAWALLLLEAQRYPTLLGLATVAYGFGLRHAVDPDHIAAIDNTTRKLMQDGKRPVGVGFFFSLGHSTVVFFLSVLVAVSASLVKSHLKGWQSTGSQIGTWVSGSFLLLIAAINLIVLIDIFKTWRVVVRGGTYDQESLEDYLNNRGLLARLFKPLLKVVSESWNMYPIGLLFGLGFDTASEVGLLGMSATASQNGMPIWYILVLPLLFVAGMALVDTTDSILMLGAYGWAYIKPVRKLYYNMNITAISVIVALFIGGIEVLQVVGQERNDTSGIWGWAQNIPFNALGFYIVGIFLVSWLCSVAFYKLRRLDLLDARASQAGD